MQILKYNTFLTLMLFLRYFINYILHLQSMCSYKFIAIKDTILSAHKTFATYRFYQKTIFSEIYACKRVEYQQSMLEFKYNPIFVHKIDQNVFSNKNLMSSKYF